MINKKTIKRLISSSLIWVLMLGQVLATTEYVEEPESVFFEDQAYSYYYEATELEKIGVFKGTTAGFELHREPTRLEALILMLRMLGLEEDVLARDDRTCYFLDVPSWGYEYVNLAYEKQLTQGIGPQEFGMTRKVDAKMFITFMLRALNYNDQVGDFHYDEAVDFAVEIGLIDTSFKTELDSQLFIRNHVAKIVFNTLNTPLADDTRTLSQVLIDSGKIVIEDPTKGKDVEDNDNGVDDDIDGDIDGSWNEDIDMDDTWWEERVLTPIMGESEATARQLERYLLSKNPNPKINISVKEFVQLWIEEGEREGVRGDLAFAQACHETGYFKYGGIVEPHQNNYGGIGALNGNATGEAATFETPQEGIRASIQHLKAYASTDPLEYDVVDPRFDMVTRGIAPNIEDLGGKWAYPGFDPSKYKTLEEALRAEDSYGHIILQKLESILDK